MFAKISLILVLNLLVFAACGHKSKPVPQPCDTGTNVSVCQTAIVEHSAWAENFKIAQTDAQTKAVIPGSERNISVIYEFFPDASGPKWSRSMIIEQAGDQKAMAEGGSVKDVGGNSLRLTVEHGTCDDAKVAASSSDLTLYYARTGSTLQLDTQPIEQQKISNPLDIFGVMIGQAIAQSLRSVLESAFSFGNAAAYLRSGHGVFTSKPIIAADEIRAKNASLGCFSIAGGFTKAK